MLERDVAVGDVAPAEGGRDGMTGASITDIRGLERTISDSGFESDAIRTAGAQHRRWTGTWD